MGHVGAEFVVVEDAAELGYEEAGLECSGAHGELVSVIGGGGDTHAADAHVLAHKGGGFEVEFVEGDDAIEAAASGHVGDSVQDLLDGEAGGHGGNLFQSIEGPVGVAEFVNGEQGGFYAELGTLAQEILAFFIAGNAQNAFCWVDHCCPRWLR